MKRLLLSFAFFIPLSFCLYYPPGSPLTDKKVKGASGNEYLIIYKNSASIGFETTRPDKNDSSVFLCIAGAFTTLDTYEIDGLYICGGKTGNKSKINQTLGGAIEIADGECKIFPTEKGRLLSDSLIREVENKNGSLFQQIQMIVGGKAATFKDEKLFQRRGIAVFASGKTAIIESSKAVTLKIFADDLAALGVKDLLYTDMGSWDEGWYRTAEGKLVTIGNNHSATAKQSNWVVFRR